MKTNKFRAWNKLSQKMIDSDELGDEPGDLQVTMINKFFNDKDLDFMQFTGLKDKNGKEIYEGDICKTRDEGELLVCDNFNKFIYMVMFSEDHSGLNGYTQQDLEVIGNIYEHKHLLNND